jgi:hypothetical protein
MSSFGKMLRIFKTQIEINAQYEKCMTCLRQKIGRRRIFHFNDGIMADFSDDEEPYTSTPVQATGRLGPNMLPWRPWLWYVIANTGSTLLKVCDYLGEHFARYFGIIAAKCQYEIDEHKRIMAEEKEERRRKENLEMCDSKSSTHVA